MKSTDISEKTIHMTHCDWIVEQAKELKALFSSDLQEVSVVNKAQALLSIQNIKNSLSELELFIETIKEKESSLDDIIRSCAASKNNEVQSEKNEYYKASDGFFDYYVNRKTGEKKLKLDENDIEVPVKLDDFSR